jgi:restriction system protein
VLITSGVYTDEAWRFAAGKPIELVEGSQLAAMLGKVRESMADTWTTSRPLDQSASRSAEPTETYANPNCPNCGSEMVRRRAGRGPKAGQEFWGCSAFPKCRGTRQLG